MSHRHVGRIAMIMLAAVSPLRAQAPLTADSVRNILADAAATANRIDSVNTVYAGLQRQAQDLVADFAKHNAEPCTYPPGQPELCANYDRERQDLNLRSADLQKEMKAADAPRRALRVHFADLMTRLRTATYAAALATQKQPLIACSNLNGVSEATACLARIQRRLPRPAPS